MDMEFRGEVWLKILLVLILIAQITATIVAIRLINRTKYRSIWIFCIVGFVALSAEQICQLLLLDGHEISQMTFMSLGVVISVCISAAVLFASLLINHIDRLDHQRQLFNKRILTAVLRAEEGSRSTFAKELHDGLGPLLSSAKMSLSALAREDGDEEHRRELLRNTMYVIDESIRSVREISNNMSPQVLLDFGLAQGVQSFISRCVSLRGTDIRFTTNLRSERFDNDVEVILYRVICELINNSLKHSGCKAIHLSLSFDGAVLRLDYSDNGRGFNPKAMLDCGMGLTNIASRINSLSGTFDITSRKGEGMSAAIMVNARGGHISAATTKRNKAKENGKRRKKDSSGR